MFVDRVGGGNAHCILALRIDSRNRIGRAFVVRQKLGARETRWQLIDIVLLKLLGRHIREVASPAWIINFTKLSWYNLAAGQSCELSDDAITHERSGTHRNIIRARDGMAYAGINPPKNCVLGYCDRSS